MLIFVYGTLKRGGSNHSWLEGQRFVGDAVTLPLFRLYELDGYPGMVADPASGGAVQGEVWKVDEECLARLDELEDIEGGEYRRDIIPLQPPFSQMKVQGYCYNRDAAGRRDLGAVWTEKQSPA